MNLSGRKQLSDSSEQHLRKETGKGWGDWFRLLDEAAAQGIQLSEMERHLREEQALSSSWAQQVTAAYERFDQGKGIAPAPVGQAFSVRMQRTIETDPDAARTAFMDPVELSKWHTQPDDLVLKSEEPNQLFYTSTQYTPTAISTLQVDFFPKEAGRVVVTIKHRQLTSELERERCKADWTWNLDSLKAYLETGSAIPPARAKKITS